VRARRRLAVVGVLLGSMLLVAGAVVTAMGLTASPGPTAVVGGYFAALIRGDAQQALAYGDLPAGPRALLTDEVLTEQQHIAPLRDVTLSVTHQDDSSARVEVRYTMDFPDGPIATSAAVLLHRAGDNWRLDQTAISTEIEPSTAGQRLSVLGGALPTGATLLFPGALPVRVDTPYLELVPSLDYVAFGRSRPAELPVRISDRGEAAVVEAVRSQLHRCFTGPPNAACPLPAERTVPGSLRGRLMTRLGGLVDLDQHNPAGLIRYAGRPTVKGSWQRLDFHNVARRQSGQIVLDVRAVGYATEPLHLQWSGR
jgi:hypothetical protein